MSASASANEPSARERRAFVWKKLHSLTGVFPVGAFLVLHLWANAHALQGQGAFDAAMGGGAERPHTLLLELFGIALPLAFHALYGLGVLWSGRPRLRGHRSARYSAYVLQRVTGLMVLAFVVYHVYELRLAPVAPAPADRFPLLCELFSSGVGGVPVRAILYLLALSAATYHLANGLGAFCASWGVTASRRAGRIVGAVAALGGLALFLLGASTVVYFSTGLRLAADLGAREELPPRLDCADSLPAAAPLTPIASPTPPGPRAPAAAGRRPERRP